MAVRVERARIRAGRSQIAPSCARCGRLPAGLGKQPARPSRARELPPRSRSRQPDRGRVRFAHRASRSSPNRVASASQTARAGPPREPVQIGTAAIVTVAVSRLGIVIAELQRERARRTAQRSSSHRGHVSSRRLRATRRPGAACRSRTPHTRTPALDCHRPARTVRRTAAEAPRARLRA